MIPHLYRRVGIKETVKEGSQEISQKIGRLQTLAFLLIQRSDLAEFVRRFTLHVRSPKTLYPEELEELVGSETIQIDQAFRTANSALSTSEVEENDLLRRLSHTSELHDDLMLALCLLPCSR